IYHYQDQNLVGITVLRASEFGGVSPEKL
ncbi:MAG: DUF2283 domain-containing protein, partial [Nitrospinota bacterium]